MKLSTKILFGFVLILTLFGAAGGYLILNFKESAPIITAIFALASVATILITTYISQSIVTPLKKIQKASEEIENRNFKARVNIKTNDELQEIGEIFNKTAQVMDKIDQEYAEIEKSKTRFLSITSHELRSPMTPMKAQLQMLQKDYFGKLSPKQKESVNIVLNNADKLDKLIADFLDVSRIEAGRLKFDFKKTDIEKTIKETIELMKAFDPQKNIKFETNIQKLPQIEADPDRITQVLRNIINNAIKFSPANTKIEITAISKKDHILVSIKDQGIGISPANQKRLFEPFFQVKQTLQGREYTGVGLGLSISRGIIQSQSGKMWVKSQEGKGSTFYFTIPHKPIQEIKPLRLLFAETEHLEKHLEEKFIEYLGPIAKIEFAEIKTQGLSEQNIDNYIKEITKQKIIDKETANNLKTEIRHIFTGEKRAEQKIEEAFT